MNIYIKNFKMSAPLTISRDELREQENYNYSAIDQYWQDQGYTEDHIKSQYKLLIIRKFLKIIHHCKFLP